MPDPVQPSRDDLIALLGARARLLAPSDDIVARALRRCLRHELRTAKRARGESRTAGPAAATEPDELSPLATPLVAGDGVPEQVAKAHTVSDDLQPIDPADSHALTAPEPAATSQLGSADQPATRRLEPGRTVGGYRIEGLLGSGGMGQVYRAIQLSMNRPVALKVLSPRWTQNSRFRERFLREARAAGRLHHPNLIAVHDAGEADARLFFSMELVEGQTVRQLLNDVGRLPEEQVWDIARQALEALRYAHGHSVIHRDIKPDNLMLAPDGVIKVADLGLSRCDADDGVADFTTQTGTMMGTPYYMPPEQGRDAHRADQRSDLYSLGATLYHVACGKVPFPGETAVAILVNATTKPLTFPEPPPSEALRSFISNLMAIAPEGRPATAAVAVDLLRRLRAGEVIAPPTSPVPARQRTLPQTRRPVARRALSRRFGGLFVAGLLATAVGAWWAASDPWQVLRRQARSFARSHRYASAIGAVDQATEQRPNLTESAARLKSDIIAEWNTWSLEESRSVFADADRAMQERRMADAAAALDRIVEEWRSPAVRERLEQMERTIDDARLRKGPDSQRFAQTIVERWLGQVMQGRPTAANGRTLLSGTGSVELPPFELRGRPAPVHVQFDVLPGDGELRLDAAEGSLVIDQAGARLEQAGQPSITLTTPDRLGVVVVRIQRRQERLVISGEQSAHLPAGVITLRWRAGADAIELGTRATGLHFSGNQEQPPR